MRTQPGPLRFMTDKWQKKTGQGCGEGWREHTHKHAHTFSHTPCCLGSDFNDLHHKISVTDLSERSKDGKHTHTHTHAETHMLTRPHTFYKLANMESITHRSRSQRGGSRPDTLPPWRAPVRLTVIYTQTQTTGVHTHMHRPLLEVNRSAQFFGIIIYHDGWKIDQRKVKSVVTAQIHYCRMTLTINAFCTTA